MPGTENSASPANIIGIDLGTSKACVARFNQSGRAEVIHNSAGDPYTPSVIQFGSGFEPEVGFEAKKSLGLGMENIFAEFKRDIGTETTWEVHGKSVTSTDLTALLLKKVVGDYADQYGTPGIVAVTWPANFRQEQREATKAAALQAGLKNACFVEEPVAAALCFARESGLDGFYLIYDLGGGTFDATVIMATSDSISVHNSAGVCHLGGKDFDDALLKLIGDKFRMQTGDQFDRNECHFGDFDLQGAKHTLSARPSVLIRLVSGKFGPISLEVTRLEYEKSVGHLIAQAEMACESALCSPCGGTHADVRISDLREVIMVGDACRMPAIQDSVARLFGKKPVIRNPSQVVAMGAAIFAALKSQPSGMTPMQSSALEKIRAEPVAPYYFGTTVLDHEAGRSRNLIVISKGEKLPFRVTRTYFTAHESQSTISCDMTQSADDTSEPDFASTIFECSLTLPKNSPRGTPITVTFACDAEGCASLTICAPPEAGGGSTIATAKISPPTLPPSAYEH